jgi:hypothetical protein
MVHAATTELEMVVIQKVVKRTRNSVISIPDLNHSSSTYQEKFQTSSKYAVLFNNRTQGFTTRKLSTITRKSSFSEVHGRLV